MNTKHRTMIVKIMIICSLFCIFSGIVIQLAVPKKYHPIYDVINIDDSKKKTIKSEYDSDVIKKKDKIIKTEPSSKETENNDDIAENNFVINENNLIRKRLENEYKIKIKYGEETKSYSVGGMITITIKDPQKINNSLKIIETELKNYPKELFSELKLKKYTLTFYLIERYSIRNVTGITDTSEKDVIISLATNYDFKDTLNHEIYHYIENYMINKGEKFEKWYLYNPGGFTYGTINAKYSYNQTFSENAFFVNNYAQTNEYEDRASTFEYMMKDNKASCMNKGTTVWLKAKEISKILDKYIKCVSEENVEYWERFINE